MTQTLALIKPDDERITALDNVFKECGLVAGGNPFAKMIAYANAVAQAEALLTDDIMRPIMHLQGKSIGFKTDKDDKGGYPVQTVRQCVIEAGIMGLQPVGNQFNIIDGRCYVTKEGTGQLLANLGIKYMVTPGLTRISTPVAVQPMTIAWRDRDGKQHKEMVEFSVRYTDKMQAAGVGIDAIIGKATKKSRAWLIQLITGLELADGDDVQSGASSEPQGRFARKSASPIDITNMVETSDAPAAPYDAEAEKLFETVPITIDDALEWYRAQKYPDFQFCEWVKKTDIQQLCTAVLNWKEAQNG
jgi:hypothetical protein